MSIHTLQQIEERYWGGWPPPHETAFVAEDTQRLPLRAVILKVHERDGERIVGYRLGLAVEEAAWGKRVGRALLERVKRHSEEEGGKYFLLLVDTCNEPALHAYHVAGFCLGNPHGVVPMIVRFTEGGRLEPDE